VSPARGFGFRRTQTRCLAGPVEEQDGGGTGELGLKQIFEAIQSMDAKLNVVGKKVNDMGKDISRISSQLGFVAEGEARDVAIRLFGADYARSLVARSVQDLVLVFPEKEEPLREPLDWATR
jgi:hypothetical protein